MVHSSENKSLDNMAVLILLGWHLKLMVVRVRHYHIGHVKLPRISLWLRVLLLIIRLFRILRLLCWRRLDGIGRYIRIWGDLLIMGIKRVVLCWVQVTVPPISIVKFWGRKGQIMIGLLLVFAKMTHFPTAYTSNSILTTSAQIQTTPKKVLMLNRV